MGAVKGDGCRQRSFEKDTDAILAVHQSSTFNPVAVSRRRERRVSRESMNLVTAESGRRTDTRDSGQEVVYTIYLLIL
jgi:hypothetical protein